MLLYQEHPPCAALAPHLACLWTCHVAPAGEPVTHRILPDNCIDILWQDVAAQGRVAGMMSSVIHVPASGPVRTIAVRFKPGAAALFFARPLHEIADMHPDLSDLWGNGAANEVTDALWSRPLTDRQALDHIERVLLRRLRATPIAHRNGMVEAAIGAIERAHGKLRVDALADSLGVSRQYLASQFRSHVGLGVKLFARVARFRHASAQIRLARPGQLDWPRLALDLGYYDQSHLIHEFRELSGSTPESFIQPHA